MHRHNVVLLAMIMAVCLTRPILAQQNDSLEKAKALHHAKNYEEAIVEYTRSIEVNPGSSEPYWWRGLSYHNLKNYDAAIADLSKYLDLEPNSSKGFGARGNVYADKGEYDQALADFQKSLELEPMAYGMNCNLSKAFLGKKDFDRAYEYAAKCASPQMFEKINQASGRNEKLTIQYREENK